MLVSICIPTYSRLHYLKQAVVSAQAQTYSNIEICISQNPKEKGPDESIKQWCEDQVLKETITYNINKKNLGLTGNLNALLSIAKGDYIIFLGDDDLLHEDFVMKLVKVIEETNAAIVFSNQFFIDANGDILEKETADLNRIYKRDLLDAGIISDSVRLVFNNSVPLSASLIKKDLFRAYSFNEKLNTPELPFFLWAALNNNRFAFVNEQLASFRLHSNSETSNGLLTHELLQEIIHISIPLEFEYLKKTYVSSTIIPAINKALMNGNFKLANFLLRSSYYPAKPLTKLAQRVLCYMPLSCIQFVFKLKAI